MAKEGLCKPIKVTQSRGFSMRVDDKIWHQVALGVWSARDPWPKPSTPRRMAERIRQGSAIPGRNGTCEMAADLAFHQALGAAVRRRRVEKGLPMKTLADHLGVSHQQLQKWETGVNRISALDLTRTASRLDCSVNELISDLGVPENPSTQGDYRFIETVRTALRGLSQKHLQAVYGLIKALGDDEAQVAKPILGSGHNGIAPTRSRRVREAVSRRPDALEGSVEPS
jgi:transcriptional regulator with XRE-family HTH domain